MTSTLSISASPEVAVSAPGRSNPHSGAEALRLASAMTMTSEGPLLVGSTEVAVSEPQRRVHTAFVDKVQHRGFTCLGARAALHAGNYRLGLYPDLDGPESTAGLAHDLWDFVQTRRGWDSPYTTFIACFESPLDADEPSFEAALWAQLARLHDIDTEAWDPEVSSDPDDPNYSFSFGGTAFFIVGLHAQSSRLARRFAWPTLVFNAHEQFERIRAAGKFAGFQRAIQARDMHLQGSLNPNLSNYGDRPENRQYSGRAVGDAWRCPMHPSGAD